MYDEFRIWKLSNNPDSLDSITWLRPDPKIPEDQELINELLQAKREELQTSTESVLSGIDTLTQSGFTSISLCVVVIFCCIMFICRR